MENKLEEQLQINFEAPSFNRINWIDKLSTPQEIFDFCNESLLRTIYEKNEDSRLEKKSAQVSTKTLGEYFSMWANTQPNGGIIVVGITKENVFEGCQKKLSDKQLNELEKTADTYCADARYKMKKIRIHRDSDKKEDFVVIFLIEYDKNRVISTSDGRVFIRIGDSKKEVKGTALRHLQAEKGEIRFETEPCGLAYPKEFNLEEVDAFIEEVRTARKWEASHSREHILSLMHLGELDGTTFIPNIAFALLFANDPRKIVPGCRIRFLRFQGETEGTGTSWNAVKDEFVDGTIPSQIHQIESILKSQLRDFSKLGKGGKFYTSSEYPEFSWYEAIVNACAHRSYGNGMKNMTIFVKMFDDRLVFESPGAFPPFVTPQNIYNMHQPRNPFLMEAMFYLKFVKCAAEGTKRIRNEMRDMELPEPEFRQEETSHTLVRVTLRNNIKQRKVWVDSDVVSILGAQIAHALNENEKRCINFVAENGEISVSDAQRLTSMTWPAASKMLKSLTKRGIFNHYHKKNIERDPGARFKLRGYESPENDKPQELKSDFNSIIESFLKVPPQPKEKILKKQVKKKK